MRRFAVYAPDGRPIKPFHKAESLAALKDTLTSEGYEIRGEVLGGIDMPGITTQNGIVIPSNELVPNSYLIVPPMPDSGRWRFDFGAYRWVGVRD